MANEQLANFLAHSMELESEARERYLELADSMAAHFNGAVADFFRRMAHDAELHLSEVSELAAGMVLPTLKAWEFDFHGSAHDLHDLYRGGAEFEFPRGHDADRGRSLLGLEREGFDPALEVFIDTEHDNLPF